MKFEEELKLKRQEQIDHLSKCVNTSIEDYLEKARSGIYSNTPENRKLGRVGQKYGETKGGMVENIYNKEKIKQERSKRLDEVYQKGVDKIDSELKKYGFSVDSVSKSLTDAGKSWYVKIKGHGVEGDQIRISDHSVGERRFVNDPTIAYIDYKDIENEDQFKKHLGVAIYSLLQDKNLVEKRKEASQKYKSDYERIEEESKPLVEKLKKENKGIFNSNRTYQTLDEIKQKHPDWEYIRQNKDGNAFNYDYIKVNSGYNNLNFAAKKDYYEFIKDKIK